MCHAFLYACLYEHEHAYMLRAHVPYPGKQISSVKARGLDELFDYMETCDHTYVVLAGQDVPQRGIV